MTPSVRGDYSEAPIEIEKQGDTWGEIIINMLKRNIEWTEVDIVTREYVCPLGLSLDDDNIKITELKSEGKVEYTLHIYLNPSNEYKPNLSSISIWKYSPVYKQKWFRKIKSGDKGTYCHLDEKDFKKKEWREITKLALSLYKKMTQIKENKRLRQDKKDQEEIKLFIKYG